MNKNRVMYYPVTLSSLAMIDGDGAILYTSQPFYSHWPSPSSQPLSSGSDTLALSLIDSLRWSFPRKLYGMSYGQVSRPEDRVWLIHDTHSFGCMFSSPLPAKQSSSTLQFASDESTLPRHRAENTAQAASLSCPNRYIYSLFTSTYFAIYFQLLKYFMIVISLKIGYFIETNWASVWGRVTRGLLAVV